ncbi:hypothetical protein F511_03953 [Dorcoceras hygrometricum]|uniref:Uncharacterized protein n=1 Tax=Dorcoceras hygrometricum TaxID=472368 RepID=A0A2Z7BZH0_9LAMI|nr:hypothetical protein F511_03953 [Dorcoceras hygrometricum]
MIAMRDDEQEKTHEEENLDYELCVDFRDCPRSVFGVVQHGQRAEHFCRIFEEDATSASSQPSSSASEVVEVIFEEVNPAQTNGILEESRTAFVFNQTAAQLRDLVHNLSLDFYSVRCSIEFIPHIFLLLERTDHAEILRADLVTALNDMVVKYRKLSQSFEEVKAEKESRATKAEPVSSDDLQTPLSKLKTENEDLRSRFQEMMNEHQRFAQISSWTKLSASLQKLQGAMKSSGDKSGLGYGSYESNIVETCTHPKLDKSKLQTMNFVKSCMEQPEESKSDESQIAAIPQIWQRRYCGVGYIAPEKPRESCLRKRIEQIRGNPKSGGRKPRQLSNAFTKERQYMPRYHKPRSQGKATAHQNIYQITAHTQVPHISGCTHWIC